MPRRASSSSTVPENTTPRERSRFSPHPVRIHDHAADDTGEAPQHVVERDEAVGQDHALDRRVRDVPLVPQRDVLERRHGVGAHQPRQAGDLLAADRVALVRHRRRALLPLAERLFDFTDLGLLQAADLERELLERRGGDRQRGHQLGVAVALDDLRRHRRRLQAEPLADPRLDRRDRGARTCRPRRRSCRRRRSRGPAARDRGRAAARRTRAPA